MGDEAPHRGSSDASSRPPTLTDLAQLCAELNRLDAHYVVIGGLAVQAHGHTRTTQDIDIVPAPTPENLRRLSAANLEISSGQGNGSPHSSQRPLAPALWSGPRNIRSAGFGGLAA